MATIYTIHYRKYCLVSDSFKHLSERNLITFLISHERLEFLQREIKRPKESLNWIVKK